MCGICVIFCSAEHNDLFETLEWKHLDRRGPDCQRQMTVKITSHIDALFYGTVLHFRGSLTPQPLEDSHGNILLWNGEIFGGIDVAMNVNDGWLLMDRLSVCQSDDQLLHLFSLIEGPWAFIFWQKSAGKLWFGRDVLGRRSLLWNLTSTDDIFALSSVQLSGLPDWTEVPSVGMYCASFSPDNSSSMVPQTIVVFPWLRWSPNVLDRVLALPQDASYRYNCSILQSLQNDVPSLTISSLGVMSNIPTISTFVEENGAVKSATADSGHTDPQQILLTSASDRHLAAADELLTVLCAAVNTRVVCQDSRCHCCLIKERIHSSCPTEAQNFCNSRGRTMVNGLNNVDVSPDVCNGLQPCIGPDSTACYRTDAEIVLTRCPLSTTSTCDDSGFNTVNDAHRPDAVVGMKPCGHTRVAVLFSGGIDSLILAALADRFVNQSEAIDLLNVAFQQMPRHSNSTKTTKPPASEYEVPDRQTGRQGLGELRTINPCRRWNFVEINVTVSELQEARSELIAPLIYPLNTVLDDSIGCAVWFAARGSGLCDGQPYTTTARVLLVGMGADEQFAGYSRHRTRYMSTGLPGLVEEIQMELDRISQRNLGRDDRVISDHGREVRCPFLDERVVRFLCSLPMNIKADLSLQRGVGEKFLLRLAAHKLGLVSGALLPKRAIQFGSRIAKAENAAERASDVCHRL